MASIGQSQRSSSDHRAVKFTPFTLSIPETEIEDLHRRLRSIRWPSRETVRGWSQAVPLAVMKSLCDYWLNTYDWQRCEAWFNSFPQYKAKIDGEEINFLCIRSTHEEALPILLLHGWPGSVLEFHKVIQPLIDPESHGGRKADAFHLVIRSLPGYGWSSEPTTTGWNLKRMAKAMVTLMETLGFREWVAQGGDWGADICAVLASENPPTSLEAVHMNTAFFDTRKEIGSRSNPTDEKQRAVNKEQAF